MKNQILVLQKLGLDEKEARFYLAALEFGPTTILKLANSTSLQRSTIYEFLDDLIEKGIIEIIISGKRKLYQGSDPKKLKSLLAQQQSLLDSIIPELSAMMGKGDQRPKIMLYEGPEGIKKVYEDTLDQPDGSEFLAFTSLEDIYNVIPESYRKSYLKRRSAKKISVRVIVKEDDFSKAYIGENKKEYRKTLAIKKEQFPLSNEINIYKNKVAILSFGDEKIGIIIESRQIAESMKAIFNVMWMSLKKK